MGLGNADAIHLYAQIHARTLWMRNGKNKNQKKKLEQHENELIRMNYD